MCCKWQKCIFLCVWITSTTCDKWLLENPAFDHKNAWMSNELPCSLEEIVFPSDYGAVLQLPKVVEISGFILPRDGAIILEQDTSINLGSNENAAKKEDCANGDSRKAYIKKPEPRKWFDPSSWRTTPIAAQNNPAIPHLERVPCNNDSVIIPRTGSLSFDLEGVTYLRLGQLSMAGSAIHKDYLSQLLKTDIGQLLFHNSDAVAVEYYRNDVCGCHKDFPSFLEPICHHVVKSCPLPHCLVVVTPFESCCAICGSVLRFSVDRCDNFKIHELRKFIAEAIKERKLSEQLDYYVNYVNWAEEGNFLQAILVDRNEYSEQSVSFVRALNSTTDWTKLFTTPYRLEIQLSGRHYNPHITFLSVLLIFLCLVFVSVVALVIFAQYAPDHRYLRNIPPWVYDPNRWRAFVLHSPFVFARFDNAGTGASDSGGGRDRGRGTTGENAHNVRESIIMGYDAERDEIRERSFDNPMYGSSPASASLSTTGGVLGMVDVTAVTEEKDTISKIPSLVTTVNLETDLLNERTLEEEDQELTEIKLESSEESDEEQETEE